ncbi:MAG: FAD-dependent oxidoreductase [Proteobacteria bacterium]|nr:FAD-dependent oxidoreductase [Pseudomonadota bacterium]
MSTPTQAKPAAPAAPPPVPSTWTTGSTTVFKTGTWRDSLARHVAAPAPCHNACPVDHDIPEWLGHSRKREWYEAWEVLVRNNPFPAITGRVCHHPCESACNRAALDQPVSICRSERFVGDQAIAEGWQFPLPARELDGHVAVVGGGPAGLSAAFQLRRRGWRVSLYEATSALGGLMRHGIPGYRLPREVLDAEIARVVALGVEVHLDAQVASPEAFAALRAEHDAVFVATGAARPRTLAQLDVTAPWLMQGAAYLAAANAGAPPALGRRLVVIGGGSAAIDTARSARRAGHEVTMLSLEARAQLPAQREEVDEAIEEGVTLADGATLERVDAGADRLRLVCSRVRFVPGPERGRFHIEPVPGSTFTLEADAVVVSIGQDADLAPFGDALAARDNLLAADRKGYTGTEGVWAGGDLTSMSRFVTQAFGMGKRAALAIHAELLRTRAERPPAYRERPESSEAIVPFAAIAHWYHDQAARAPHQRLEPEQRLGSAEVALGFAEAEAVAESSRCFSCGTCIDCDNCVAVCPDLAVRRLDEAHNQAVGTTAAHYEVLADYCKGCGLCVRECPTGAMVMEDDRR